MKKLVSMIIVILLVLPVRLIGHAASDVTPPKLIKASINMNEAKVGDNIVLIFELDPDVESGLNEDTMSSGIITLRHTSGASRTTVYHYVGNNQYRFEWSQNSKILKGKWYVENITFSDNAGNFSSYSYDHPLMKDLYFNLIDGAEVPTKPVLMDFSIRNPVVTPNEKVMIDLSIIDPSQVVLSGVITFRHKITNDYFTGFIKFNKETNGWEGSVEIPNSMKNGEWNLFDVTLNGNNQNSTRLYASDYPFLINQKFTVSGGVDDFTKPIFHSVTLSKSVIKPGDTFIAYVDAEDNETGITEVNISIKNKVTSHAISTRMSWNEDEKKYKSIIKLPIQFPQGQYEISQIDITDAVRNTRFILPSENPGILPELNVQSVFYGTEGVNNVLLGDSFNPMLNVGAISNYEGDLTPAITYSGNVDTQTKGVYLITYSVKSKKEYYNYKDYRWISVNEDKKMENSELETTAYFKSNINVVVPEDASVNLSNGNKTTIIKGKNLLTNEGKYSVAVKSTQSGFTQFSSSQVGSASNGHKQFNFVIDRTAPRTTLNKVTATSTSISGVTERKATINIKINNKYSYKSIADDKGKFVIKIPKQKVNTKISYQATDLAGNTSKSQTSKVIVPLSIKPISDKSISVSGQTLPSATVKLYINGKYIKNVKANNVGEYKISISKQSAGKIIKVLAITKNKEISPYVQTKVSDKTAPAISVINKITSNSTYVTGKAEKNAMIIIDAYELESRIGYGKVSSDGTFKIKISKVQKGWTVRVRAIDGANNSSEKVIKVN